MPRHQKNIALFGGSFNPPHEGHRQIVRRLARRRSIDEVWVLPVWRHAFGKRLPEFKKRMAACRKFFKTSSKIKTKAYEKRPRVTGTTVDLLLYLKRRFPLYRFFWVMGSDTYRQRKNWHDFPKIRRMARLIVFPRGPRSPIPDISSTALRRRRPNNRVVSKS